jgi:hypothetical protein
MITNPSPSHLISSHLISSHLISCPRMITNPSPSHLISSHLMPTHDNEPHLISSHLLSTHDKHVKCTDVLVCCDSTLTCAPSCACWHVIVTQTNLTRARSLTRRNVTQHPHVCAACHPDLTRVGRLPRPDMDVIPPSHVCAACHPDLTRVGRLPRPDMDVIPPSHVLAACPDPTWM